MSQVIIRDLRPADCQIISAAFASQGWTKPTEQFHTYFLLQKEGTRDFLLAEWEREFAGYLTIQWVSHYRPFQRASIPEIVDFNVLQKFQRRGIGKALMDAAESRIKRVSAHAGIGFGLTSDYGAAQVFYIKRGYIPDGRGLVKDSISLALGQTVEVNHDLALYLTKLL